MKLTSAEKLSLVMLSELYEKLGVNGEVDADFVKSAIFSGNTWALTLGMPGIVGDDGEDTPPNVLYVMEVMDMWESIEHSIQNLDDKQREDLNRRAAPYGVTSKFEGFDGNNEGELMGIAKFLVEKMHRFSSFTGRSFNSHGPSAEGYKRMLKVHGPSEASWGHLAVDELVTVLMAKSYPEH
ncbi:YfbU family protein [Achromobacter sp. PAB15]|uniref:YfbU family protein n=1 Tax=Achromobacter sp. PAB15 TaxID=3233048 RepID=UPI003F93982B